MKILEGRTGTGFTVSGESVMIDKFGDVYPTIDNVMHPNPGTEEDEYSEAERCVDWLYLHDFKSIRNILDMWVARRAAFEITYDPRQSDEEIIHNIFYDDVYQLSTRAKDSAVDIIQNLRKHPEIREINLRDEKMELTLARKIASFINEKFLRVRAGGKLNPEGADAIYFRISSHGYDWHRVIVDFLWDTFKEPSKMPRRIWIGHDAETNPPEIVLYDGTPEDLLDKYDDRLFESDMFQRSECKRILENEQINFDRACYRLNKHHLVRCHKFDIQYVPFS